MKNAASQSARSTQTATKVLPVDKITSAMTLAWEAVGSLQHVMSSTTVPFVSVQLHMLETPTENADWSKK